jgi:hypothetical protein
MITEQHASPHWPRLQALKGGGDRSSNTAGFRIASARQAHQRSPQRWAGRLRADLPAGRLPARGSDWCRHEERTVSWAVLLQCALAV